VREKKEGRRVTRYIAQPWGNRQFTNGKKGLTSGSKVKRMDWKRTSEVLSLACIRAWMGMMVFLGTHQKERERLQGFLRHVKTEKTETTQESINSNRTKKENPLCRQRSQSQNNLIRFLDYPKGKKSFVTKMGYFRTRSNFGLEVQG